MAGAPRHFGSFIEARTQLPSVLDAAREGLVTTSIATRSGSS